MKQDIKLFIGLLVLLVTAVGYHSLEEKFQLLIAVHSAVFIMSIFAYKAMESTLSMNDKTDASK